MPRGFLVKRYCKTSSSSSSSSLLQRLRRYSDEDRSDSSSDHDIADGVVYCHGNRSPGRPPASGHANSPDSARCSPSPPLPTYSNSQDEPLALTTGSNHNRTPLYPLGHSVLYFPRLPEAIPSTPPRPKSDSVSPLSTPFPPKKRPAAPDNNGLANNPVAASEPKPKPPKRPKVARKLNFDEDKSSPVSGTFIRDVDSDDDLLLPPASAVRRGDIDPSLNVVVITEEARAELAKIENRIGDYVCQLCKENFPDAFGLAQHRCSRIVHVEYRCPECDKVFNCPANLASHRRWHKPRPPPANGHKTSNPTPRLLPSNVPVNPATNGCLSDPQNVANNLNNKHDGFSTDPSDTESMRDTPSPGSLSNGGEGVAQGFSNSASDEGQYECDMCDKKFRRQGYLRKHQQTHLTMSSVVDHDDSASHDDAAVNHPFSKSMMLHVSSTSNDGEEPTDYSCPSCGVTCLTRHEMEKHTASHHSSEVYPCKYCTSTFYSSAGLTRHINKYHPSENRQVILLQLSSVRPLST